MSSARYFDNPFDDFNPDIPTNIWSHDSSGKIKIHDILADRWKKFIDQLLEELEEGLKKGADDGTVYTGSSGVALMYLHLHEALHGNSYMSKCKEYFLGPNPYLQKCEFYLHQGFKAQGHKHEKMTFLCGEAGPLAIAAVLYHRFNKPHVSAENLKKLIDLEGKVVGSSDMPYELLYGRVGYISALLFVRRHLGREYIPDLLFKPVIDVIISHGQKAAKDSGGPPLVFFWHDSFYFGAAHGLAGILCVLMRVPQIKTDPELKKIIGNTVDYMMKYRLPTGNYPSSERSRHKDELVHWCHGAPGWIHTFLLAYQLFNKDEYLKEARLCADVIWKRGLLKKGHGLCHGTSGNAYAFLKMFQVTKEGRYLYRAVKFASWVYDFGFDDMRTPDRPYSLFEGLAGVVYFFVDLLVPEEARFPAFY